MAVRSLLVFLALIAAAQAQTTATIEGTVRDPSGAVVPGARAEITDTSTTSRQVQVALKWLF